ncbi:hypothetical protein ACFLWA_02760 [Chloroflexota bacterium]
MPVKTFDLNTILETLLDYPGWLVLKWPPASLSGRVPYLGTSCCCQPACEAL